MTISITSHHRPKPDDRRSITGYGQPPPSPSISITMSWSLLMKTKASIMDSLASMLLG